MRTTLVILLAAILMGGGGLVAVGKSFGDESAAPLMDCTFVIKGNFNGTVVDVTITVSDVSFVECAVLKLGVKKALK